MNIISIGPTCLTATLLRQIGLREKAYPYDWSRDTTVREIIDVIKQGDDFDVEKWFRFSDLKQYLPHDQDGDTHGNAENNFESATRIDKYKRRFNRFFADIKKPDTHLVRFGPSAEQAELDLLKQLLPNVTIHLIDKNMSESDQKECLRRLFPNPHPFAVWIHNTHINGMFPNKFDALIEELPEPYMSIIKNADHNDVYDTVNEFLSFIGQTLTKAGYVVSQL